MITFALVPVRSRILAAKLIASVVLSLAMLVMSVAVVAAGVAAADGRWSDAGTLIGQSAVYLTTGMVVGVALSTILLATAPAIVALFALPITWTAVASLSFFADAAPWLDTRLALAPFGRTARLTVRRTARRRQAVTRADARRSRSATAARTSSTAATGAFSGEPASYGGCGSYSIES
jgi:hypothetical protein